MNYELPVIKKVEVAIKIPRCLTCGSDDILRDAWAKWNKNTNEWKLHSTFDSNAYCQNCEGEASVGFG